MPGGVGGKDTAPSGRLLAAGEGASWLAGDAGVQATPMKLSTNSREKTDITNILGKLCICNLLSEIMVF